ncbi:MAG: hypothetical protein H6717_34440 [Polyangiaceae bacterium]|nr:hypothetical protein [Polyangiaceae bacterium]MCB9576794.1 hypothetical protein [Polyangiaceae bacterium]MCB9582184.1 hypothetical protein [Polyangiaceae bacterium]
MPRTDPAGRIVQIRWDTTLTSEQYVTQEAWRCATLEQCPLHPEGDCGLVGHGSYTRKSPTGVRVARLLCPKSGVTISLLPDFLAARMPGTLEEIEGVVAAAQAARTTEGAAALLRPAESGEVVTLPSVLRWLRRRMIAVEAGLLAAVTSLPVLSGCAPTIVAVRERLGVVSALVALRRLASHLLRTLPAPLGFGARARRRPERAVGHPHDMGPDPPERGQ